MTTKKTTETEAENNLFRNAVADASPITASDRHHGRPKAKPPKPQQSRPEEQEGMMELPDPSPDWLHDFNTSTIDELSYRSNGVQPSVLRKLRRGQFPSEAELDLHGYTVATARTELSQFLLACLKNDMRCIRVIHGKGHGSGNRGPVIKSHVDYWLRQHHEVMAFCSAKSHDGGTGAVYVLLRNAKKMAS